jgi:hypothetical protein
MKGDPWVAAAKISLTFVGASGSRIFETPNAPDRQRVRRAMSKINIGAGWVERRSILALRGMNPLHDPETDVTLSTVRRTND